MFTLSTSKVSKEQAEEEAKDIKEDDESGYTGFMADEDGIYLLNYIILGFMRSAGNNLKEHLKIKQLKSKLEEFVFVRTRKIRFTRDGETIKVPDGVLERPLRGMTAQGPRVTLVKSDYVKAGATLSFQIDLLEHKEITTDTIKEIFEYGQLKGLGQFRNGGYGLFEVTKFEVVK